MLAVLPVTKSHWASESEGAGYRLFVAVSYARLIVILYNFKLQTPPYVRCREDPHLVEKLKQNPEEGKVRVVSTAEGDLSISADWFKGGRAGPTMLFAAASTQGKSGCPIASHNAARH